MKYYIASHVREEKTHKLIGLTGAWYDIDEWDCTNLPLEAPENNSTLAKLYRQIMQHRKEAGLQVDNCYIHFICISPMFYGHGKTDLPS